MAIISRGEYGAPADIIFSFPVTIENGQWKIVQGLKISDFAREKINLTGKELLEEKSMALN
jgi:malate dehydrogenase